MNIYIYSDESGVFDYLHNDIFVFGGLIFLSKEEKDIASRKYIHAESKIRSKYSVGQELKACIVKNQDKGKLYRSLNNYHKFGVVVKQKELQKHIFDCPKSKQRYLDYAYKIAVKSCLNRMIQENLIIPSEVKNMYFYVDEHTTATNGRYELQEGLLEEFKRGTFNWKWDKFYPPLFSNLCSLDVRFCDSITKTLIRSADIVANNIYYKAVKENRFYYRAPNILVIKQP